MNRSGLLLSLLLLSLSLPAFAGKLPHTAKEAPQERASVSLPLQDLRLQKRFGVGIAAGGGVAMFGIEVDVNLTEDYSLSGALGTGIDYSTFAIKGRYFLLGREFSPYLGLGFARWWTNGTQERNVAPAILKNEFLADEKDFADGFSVYILYPAFGVQFLHQSGFSMSAELQYMFRMFNFSNGTYAGLSAQWYF